MLSADDRDELRLLQRTAYGRDGALTEQQAQRLAALETQARTEAAAVAQALPVPPLVTTELEDLFREERPAEPASTEARSEDPSREAPSEDAVEGSAVAPGRRRDARPFRGVRALRRRFGLLAAAASVLLLVIGVGVGWALFGAEPDDITLTAEQQQRRLELYEKGPYDEGSIRAVGQDRDALVWYGTQNDGADACIVIDVGSESGRQCQTIADAEPLSVWASVMAMTTVGEESDDVESVNVSAYLLFSTSGEPMVSIQRWSQSGVMLRGFQGEERERAKELTADDDTAYLRIVGSFRDEPVWLIERMRENTAETCMVVDAAEQQSQCVPSQTAIDGGISTLAFVDDGTGGSEMWSLQVAYTVDQTPYLVVARDQNPVSVTSGETYQEYGERMGLDDAVDEADGGSTGTAPSD